MRHPRWLLIVLVLALVAILGLSACADKITHNTTTTVNIHGPFQECTVIFLPDLSQVRFGDRGVEVTGPSTIAVGNTTYNVDLSSCNARTETTTTNPPPA